MRKLNQIIGTMKQHVNNIERDCVKTILSNLKVAQNQLKQVKRKLWKSQRRPSTSTGWRIWNSWKHKIGEEFAKSYHNWTTKSCTPTHQQIHKEKTSSNIKYIDIPIDSLIPFDKISKSFLTKTGVVSINQKR